METVKIFLKYRLIIHLFKKKKKFNNVKVFTVTFDLFNASLVCKIINLTDLKLEW